MSKFNNLKAVLSKIPRISKIVWISYYLLTILRIALFYFQDNAAIDVIQEQIRGVHFLFIVPLLMVAAPCLDRSCDNTGWFLALMAIGVFALLPIFWAVVTGLLWSGLRQLLIKLRFMPLLERYWRRHGKKTLMISGICLSIIVIFWLPWLVLWFTAQPKIQTYVHVSDRPNIAIVFGGIVRPDESLSETNRERLLAAKVLRRREAWFIDATKQHRFRRVIDKILVSNHGAGAKAMKDFLIAEGIPRHRVIVDDQAQTTADTCRHVATHDYHLYDIIFISHRYHLPRLLYQCQQLGVIGIGFPAEAVNTIQRMPLPWWQKIQIRNWRYVREAGLSWLVWLQIYK